MACVRKRRGRWILDFTDQHGIRRWVTTRWSSDADKLKAEKLLARFAVQVDDGTFEARSEQRNFIQLVDSYISQLDVRAHTKREYEQIINSRVKIFFGAMKLRAITPRNLEEYREWVQRQGKAVRTINKDLTLLSMMFKYAEGHRWVVFNPCKHVKRLRESIDKRRQAIDGNIFTAKEAKQLIDAAGSLRDRVLFRMAIETGMRQGELLGLRWDDIDWAHARVHVRNSYRKGLEIPPKTAASLRTVGLTVTMLSELKRWKLACPQPPGSIGIVFPNTKGSHERHYNLLRRSFFPALRRAGLRKIRFHDLRHTCASLLLAAGVRIKEVQAHLGHASSTMTLDIYGHLMPEAVSHGARAFEAILGDEAVISPDSSLQKALDGDAAHSVAA